MPSEDWKNVHSKMLQKTKYVNHPEKLEHYVLAASRSRGLRRTKENEFFDEGNRVDKNKPFSINPNEWEGKLKAGWVQDEKVEGIAVHR